MVTIDARGENCPIPVIRAKKAIKEIETNGIVLVKVDNKIATENLEKMANEYGLKINIKKNSDIDFEVTIIKGNAQIEENSEQNISNKNIIIISSDKMGDGSEELGKTLLKSFIYTLTEMEILPEKIFFYNKGVFLTTDGSDSIPDLKKLSSHGVKIYSCGACLNYYNLSEKLEVGETTNMYEITKALFSSEKIIKP